MVINLDPRCSIFFGNASTSPVSHKNEAQFKGYCNELRQQLDLKNIVVQHQVHGTDGWFIDDINQLTSPAIYKEREGDFLITNQQGLGIGVITADCLSIIFYAPQHNLVAVAHAGWRGSVAGITIKVLENFIQKYNLDVSQVQVYFGPAARSCCYEVQQDFVNNLPSGMQSFVTQRDGKYFFDNSGLNKQQLTACGILPEKIYDQYNLCTICNHQFCSYRRSETKEEYKSQTTVVWLR